METTTVQIQEHDNGIQEGEMTDKVVLGDCTLYLCDSLEVMKEIPDQSVNCCVTSPPYFGLRDYGVDEQIGLEQTPEEYVDKLVLVFREVKRILRDDGTLWLNLGDSYAGSGKGGQSGEKRSKNWKPVYGNKGMSYGLKPKDLIGIPWMVAFALRADGWYLRSDIIWHKPNPMPESVKDRPTKSHEYIFLLSKSAKYYYDYEAIQEPTKGNEHDKRARISRKRFPTDKIAGIRKSGYYPMANKRDVWTVNTKPFKEAHFAVFPEKLIIPCILAGCPKGGIVLDPFSGSGTTGIVCVKNNRKFIGIDINKEYIEMSAKRIKDAQQQMRLPL